MGTLLVNNIQTTGIYKQLDVISMGVPIMGDGPRKYGHVKMENHVNPWVALKAPSPGIQGRRRKFRSQTSDNMERWKSRGGKSQGGEDKRWRRSKRQREDAGGRKGRKVAIHCVSFQ